MYLTKEYVPNFCVWWTHLSWSSGSSSASPWKDEHPVACLWVSCDSQSSCLGPAYSLACPPSSLAEPALCQNSMGTPQTDSSSFAPTLRVSTHSKVWAKSCNTTENNASAECHGMLSQGRPPGKGSLNCSGPLASNYMECFWRLFRIDIPVSHEAELGLSWWWPWAWPCHISA